MDGNNNGTDELFKLLYCKLSKRVVNTYTLTTSCPNTDNTDQSAAQQQITTELRISNKAF
jgi:hypothetical protein